MFDSTPAGGTGVSAPGDAVVASVLANDPGPDSAAILDAVELTSLSRQGTLDYLKAWEQLTAWTTARPMAAMVAFVGTRDARLEGDALDQLQQSSAFDELRLAMNLSGAAVESRVAVARDLRSRLRQTAHALESGDLSYLHARAMSESLSHVTAREVACDVESQALAKTGRPVGRFRRTLRSLVDACDPEATKVRHESAAAARTIKRWALPDGMGCLQVEAPAPDIGVLWSALSLLAGPADRTDSRRIGARRVDALLGLCLAAVAPDPDAAARRPLSVAAHPRVPIQAQVVVDLATLLGLADNPTVLRGYGPVPAGVGREWLTQATTWRRLVTDPVDGHLLDYGPVVRSAPRKLRDYLTNRHPRCCFPGCTRSSGQVDLDHEPPWRPYGSGGRTSSTDLRPLCRRHHRTKTFLKWEVEYLADGGVIWTSPSGTVWNIPPPAVLDDD